MTNMQANIGTDSTGSFTGYRALIIKNPFQPLFYLLTNKYERINKMAHFGDIAKTFNSYVIELVRKKKIKNTNGLYLRTMMVFMAYSCLGERAENLTPSKAMQWLEQKLNWRTNSASMSRNNAVLFELGLITMIEDPEDARAKVVILTKKGEEFAKLMR